jgi:hypothetical protein
VILTRKKKCTERKKKEKKFILTFDEVDEANTMINVLIFSYKCTVSELEILDDFSRNQRTFVGLLKLR